MNKNYALRYLPRFEQDLREARDYICYNLQNPVAALKLVEDTEKAILKRLENPLSFQPFLSAKKRKHLYYRINVGNFSVFYVVIDNIMEVRRFVYSKRNLQVII